MSDKEVLSVVVSFLRLMGHVPVLVVTGLPMPDGGCSPGGFYDPRFCSPEMFKHVISLFSSDADGRKNGKERLFRTGKKGEGQGP